MSQKQTDTYVILVDSHSPRIGRFYGRYLVSARSPKEAFELLQTHVTTGHIGLYYAYTSGPSYKVRFRKKDAKRYGIPALEYYNDKDGTHLLPYGTICKELNKSRELIRGSVEKRPIRDMDYGHERYRRAT